MKRITFVTTCKGRAFHIKSTLPQNLRDNPDSRFLILDYESPDDLIGYLESTHGHEIASGRLMIYRFKNGGGPFHMAHAKNMAMRCAIREGADILVTLDADNFTGPAFEDFIRERMGPRIFLAPKFPLDPYQPENPQLGRRGIAGRLAIEATAFIKVGGYDEMYNTWRGEDIDLVCRMRRNGYVEKPVDLKYLHAIPHSAAVRFKEWPEAQEYENRKEFDVIRARTETIVNHGRIGVGEVRRHQTGGPVELAPVATRVFGIGMHRTGTTSFHEAMKILGHDSFHWGAGEAPVIWQEMTKHGRSPTLEQWYALSDLPIPLLFRQLDKSYPGSKFVLTVRNEQDWLRSVEKLWDERYNPNRWMWDVWPFSHHIHTVMYGQREFDRQIFLDRYRRHNCEVADYFAATGRKGDLCVLDLDAEHKWESLCGFLRCPIPTIPYPLTNRTTAHASQS